MKITVIAENYTGANFRGIQDEADSNVVRLTCVGQEKNIVAYLLESFSYGYDREESPHTISGYIQALRNGEISQFDGCGGVFKVFVEDEKRAKYNGARDFNLNPREEKNAHVLEVNVDDVPHNDMFYHLNRLINKIHNQ